jgi:hypothetical protein
MNPSRKARKAKETITEWRNLQLIFFSAEKPAQAFLFLDKGSPQANNA